MTDGVLRGIPAGRGKARGRARVAHTPDEAASLQTGEILIASALDVAWTPYLPVIAGLASEVGSIMSHGAVVAREYGLPTVTGLQNATRIFTTGERVVLDGDRGTLELDPDQA
jgi:pyruvate,water dikinase